MISFVPANSLRPQTPSSQTPKERNPPLIRRSAVNPLIPADLPLIPPIGRTAPLSLPSSHPSFQRFTNLSITHILFGKHHTEHNVRQSDHPSPDHLVPWRAVVAPPDIPSQTRKHDHIALH